MPTCTRCEETKPRSEFWIDRASNGPKSHCKACSRDALRAWRRRQPDYQPPTAPNNPLHRARWARLRARATPALTIEKVFKGNATVEQFVFGRYMRSVSPLSLPRVRFIERDGE